MKTKILFVVLMLAAAAVSIRMNLKRERLDSLMLENLEALSFDEWDGTPACFGYGSVDCPSSPVKVYIVATLNGKLPKLAY